MRCASPQQPKTLPGTYLRRGSTAQHSTASTLQVMVVAVVVTASELSNGRGTKEKRLKEGRIGYQDDRTADCHGLFARKENGVDYDVGENASQ